MAALQGTEALSAPHWARRCQEIAADAATRAQFDFLRWPSLSDISVTECYPDVFTMLYEALRKSGEWDCKWFNLTRDVKLGHPKDFSLDSGSSPILIQHAYHLHLYESRTGLPLSDSDIIFEIGGGFGSFCRLLRNYGFRGPYIIYDLPHLGEIQRLFLCSLGMKELKLDDITANLYSGFCLVDHSKLDRAIRVCEKIGNLGLVATWSLSEMPMHMRKEIFPFLHRSIRKYLISYEPVWGGFDNVQYFRTFCDSRPGVNWVQHEIPRSRYLIASV